MSSLTEKSSVQLATSQTLTSSYVIGDEIDARTNDRINVYGEDVGSLTLVYTTGASETGTTCRFRLDFSHDGTNWFQEQKGTETGGVNTLSGIVHAFGGGTGSTAYYALYNFQIVAKYMRVMFTETGSPSNAGTIDCDLTLGAGVGYGGGGGGSTSVTVNTEFADQVDDAAFNVGSDVIMPIGYFADETATDSVDEGDMGAARMTLTRKQITASEFLEDTAHSSGDYGTHVLTVRNDTLAALAGTDGDYAPLQVDANGALYINLSTTLDATNDAISTQPVEPSNTNTTALATNLVVKASAGTAYEIRGHNDNASAQYIQIHDASSLPADTAVPEDVILVAGDSNFSITYPQGKAFATGIVVCNSSTLATKTIGAADCWFSAEYL